MVISGSKIHLSDDFHMYFGAEKQIHTVGHGILLFFLKNDIADFYSTLFQCFSRAAVSPASFA